MSSTRLSLCRYLYDRAQATLDIADNFSFGLSVSLAQDAVETMLYEIGSTVNANIPQHATFPKTWSAVNQAEKMRNPLPYSHDMESLNNCRVAFKHHSNLPDEPTARRHLVNAGYFLDTVSNDVLGICWAEVSLADAIRDSDIRTCIKAAEAALNSNDLEESRQQCSLAYSEIQSRFRQLLPELPSGLIFHSGTPQDQILEALMEATNRLSVEVANVSLGVNRVDTMRFESLTPRALVSPVSKSVQYVDTRLREYTVDDIRFCIRHITQMALRYEDRYSALVG